MNILIIEDDKYLSSRIKYVFEKNIIVNRVKIIENYIDFINLSWTYLSYDIILLDIILDKKDINNWIDILRKIRFKDKKIPIVLISWISELSYIEKAFNLWANDYLVKPFRLEELKLRVFRWFIIIYVICIYVIIKS